LLACRLRAMVLRNVSRAKPFLKPFLWVLLAIGAAVAEAMLRAAAFVGIASRPLVPERGVRLRRNAELERPINWVVMQTDYAPEYGGLNRVHRNLRDPSVGTEVFGVVERIVENVAIVDIGLPYKAVLPRELVTNDEKADGDIRALVRPGDRVKARVVRVGQSRENSYKKEFVVSRIDLPCFNMKRFRDFQVGEMVTGSVVTVSFDWVGIQIPGTREPVWANRRDILGFKHIPITTGVKTSDEVLLQVTAVNDLGLGLRTPTSDLLQIGEELIGRVVEERGNGWKVYIGYDKMGYLAFENMLDDDGNPYSQDAARNSVFPGEELIVRFVGDGKLVNQGTGTLLVLTMKDEEVFSRRPLPSFELGDEVLGIVLSRHAEIARAYVVDIGAAGNALLTLDEDLWKSDFRLLAQDKVKVRVVGKRGANKLDLEMIGLIGTKPEERIRQKREEMSMWDADDHNMRRRERQNKDEWREEVDVQESYDEEFDAEWSQEFQDSERV